MQASDKDKSHKKSEDIIDGDATIIDETASRDSSSSKKDDQHKKSSAKTQQADNAADSHAHASFSKLGLLALCLGIGAIALSIYMAFGVQELKSTIAMHETELEQAQSQAGLAQEEAMRLQQNSQAKIEELNAQLRSAFDQLKTDFEDVKSQLAETKQSNLSPISPAVDLSIVMVMWADAQKGGRLDRYEPLIKTLPASQTKTSIIDILALAGDSSHADLRQRAKALSQMNMRPDDEGQSSGFVSDFTNWLGGIVNLRPVKKASDAASIAQAAVSNQDQIANEDDQLRSLENWYDRLSQSDTPSDELASWQIEAQARLKADKTLASLLQTLISRQIEG